MASILNPTVYKIPRWERLLKHLITIPQVNWYYQLKASKQFDELTLQRVMKYKFDALLPKHTAVYYNKNIQSTKSAYNKRKPDFLMWDNSYSVWYIIEVEMENHGTQEIEKQLSAFYYGDYSDINGITDYVKSKSPKLDERKFKALISSKRPRLILMSDIIDCSWRDDFEQYDCMYSTLQVYSDGNDEFVYRIGGEFPQEFTKFSYCNLDKHIRAFDIDRKEFLDNLGYTDGDVIVVHYHGEPDEWEYRITKYNEALLIYLGDVMKVDLTQKRWRLIVNDKGHIHLIK